jgi:hypothetical protein
MRFFPQRRKARWQSDNLLMKTLTDITFAASAPLRESFSSGFM